MRYTDGERIYFVEHNFFDNEWNIFYQKIGGKEKRLRYRGPEGIWSESQEKVEKNLVKAAKRHKWLKVVENDECCQKWKKPWLLREQSTRAKRKKSMRTLLRPYYSMYYCSFHH